jgi:hypothetical protein
MHGLIKRLTDWQLGSQQKSAVDAAPKLAPLSRPQTCPDGQSPLSSHCAPAGLHSPLCEQICPLGQVMSVGQRGGPSGQGQNPEHSVAAQNSLR